MKSIRSTPTVHAAEGDERNRTAVPAPGEDLAYDDRRIHASYANGGIEIVRYDRRGKWYVEVAADFGRPGLAAERFHTTVQEAARRAVDLRSRGGAIFEGVPGGATFDRLVRGAA